MTSILQKLEHRKHTVLQLLSNNQFFTKQGIINITSYHPKMVEDILEDLSMEGKIERITNGTEDNWRIKKSC